MKVRAPANVLLRRAQLTLMLVTLVPTVLSTGVGIVLLAVGEGASLSLVSGVLVLAFAATAISGYILGTIFVSRGASLTRVQNDFLSQVSHELRTPLTSIGLFIESLRNERLTDPAEKERCLSLLEQEVHRLQQLIKRLIDLSRLESGPATFEMTRVAVRELIDDALGQLCAAAVPELVDVEVDCPEDLVIEADRAAMALALGNLLTNAWKYTDPANRRIKVRGELFDGHVIIEVSDNGPGIPREEQEKVFYKFERGADAVDSGTVGTGLGLAIVRATVEAHRGEIELRSGAGLGATFRIKLLAPKAS